MRLGPGAAPRIPWAVAAGFVSRVCTVAADPTPAPTADCSEICANHPYDWTRKCSITPFVNLCAGCPECEETPTETTETSATSNLVSSTQSTLSPTSTTLSLTSTELPAAPSPTPEWTPSPTLPADCSTICGTHPFDWPRKCAIMPLMSLCAGCTECEVTTSSLTDTSATSSLTSGTQSTVSPTSTSMSLTISTGTTTTEVPTSTWTTTTVQSDCMYDSVCAPSPYSWEWKCSFMPYAAWCSGCPECDFKSTTKGSTTSGTTRTTTTGTTISTAGSTTTIDTGAGASAAAVEVVAGYTADETLPADVTTSDLMSSAAYTTAKKAGLVAALSVPDSDITITGFSLGTRRLSSGSLRQLVLVVSVKTSFKVKEASISTANTLATAIAGASAAIKAQTDIAMATADWSGESVITAAPTMMAIVIATPIVVSTGGTTEADGNEDASLDTVASDGKEAEADTTVMLIAIVGAAFMIAVLVAVRIIWCRRRRLADIALPESEAATSGMRHHAGEIHIPLGEDNKKGNDSEDADRDGVAMSEQRQQSMQTESPSTCAEGEDEGIEDEEDGGSVGTLDSQPIDGAPGPLPAVHEELGVQVHPSTAASALDSSPVESEPSGAGALDSSPAESEHLGAGAPGRLPVVHETPGAHVPPPESSCITFPCVQ